MPTETQNADIDAAPSALDDWHAIQSLFARARKQPIRSWFYGMSPRLGRKRLLRLLDIPAAGVLAALLDQRDIGRVKALRTYAAINQEQAAAALRMTIIINVSVPIIAVTLLSQMSSGALWADLWAFYQDARYGTDLIIILSAATLSVILGILMFGATQLGKARDIRHLIDLFAADRGIYFGLDDMDDLQAD